MADHVLSVCVIWSACETVNLQDKMESGALLQSEKTPNQKYARMGLADALAMLGLQHAHVVHEADPDTKVDCPTLVNDSGIERVAAGFW